MENDTDPKFIPGIIEISEEAIRASRKNPLDYFKECVERKTKEYERLKAALDAE